jgi:hypothetical protein
MNDDITIEAMLRLIKKQGAKIRMLERHIAIRERDAVMWCARAGIAEGLTQTAIQENINDIKGV